MEKWIIYKDEEYLEHHGVKGQKWGIRRYQNEDGTFTDEGKKRYSNLDSKFKNNVYDHEYAIAVANYNNLKNGRKFYDDDVFSKKMREKSIKIKKDGEKMLNELFESGYYQKTYGFDPKKVNYGTFKDVVEKQAYKQGSLQLYGRKLSQIEYEMAIINYTSKYSKESNNK